LCGIIAAAGRDLPAGILEKARAVQIHRGPDGNSSLRQTCGEYVVDLAHQRLAIIDLSAAGLQPMNSASANSNVIFNGEIYNYREIRDALRARGVIFRTESDTEVMLEAIETFGIEQAHQMFNGMWAFVLLQKKERRLIVSRDRFGVKPLYYLKYNERIYFASEIKTLLQMVDQRLKVNHVAVERFIAQSQMDYDEETFFAGIRKIPAGHYAQIDLAAHRLDVKLAKYWTLSVDETGPTTVDVAVEEIRALLTDAVRIRLRSDVPVGALVSGGVDSSAIAAVMHESLPRTSNVNFFGAVSDDPRFDESRFMDAVAGFLGRQVQKVRLSFGPQDALNLIETALWHNDEPFGNFTPVAKYLLMQRARELGITVILSGQGADEIFCGYLKYLGFHVQALLRQHRYAEVARSVFGFWRQGTVLSQFNYADAKRYVPGFLRHVRNVRGPALREIAPLRLGLNGSGDVREYQICDVERFSVPVLTHWEDRMSMAWSREIRNPFLDYRLVQAAVRLPMNLKLRGGWTKYVLRRAIDETLPHEITWRRDKQGFSTPIGEWLKQDLVTSVLGKFSEDALIFRTGLLDRHALLDVYSAYRRQPHDKGAIRFTEIFNPLVLEMWMQKFADHLQLA
jgi:asparagine synthase (glutamine-hydrolysing)